LLDPPENMNRSNKDRNHNPKFDGVLNCDGLIDEWTRFDYGRMKILKEPTSSSSWLEQFTQLSREFHQPKNLSALNAGLYRIASIGTQHAILCLFVDVPCELSSNLAAHKEPAAALQCVEKPFNSNNGEPCEATSHSSR